MNQIERFVYDFVKNNQILKNIIRNLYQSIFYLIPVKKIKCKYNVVVRNGYFFGFHDKNPWSHNNKFLLSHGFSIKNRKIKPEDKIKIGYFVGDNFEIFNCIAESKSFNWQQGSMLQWIGKTNTFIFNDFDGEKNISRLFNIDNSELDSLPFPVSAISPEGNWALSYSFERLQVYAPGYGYINGNTDEIDLKIPEKSGIDLIDLKNKTKITLFTVKDIVNKFPDEKMNDLYHFFTHTLFSPTGERFFFLHRAVKNNKFVYTRLFTCNKNGTELFMLPTDGMVSHISWYGPNHIIAYCKTKMYGDAYVLFTDKESSYTIIGEKHFNSDGHPQVLNHSDWMVTDTYPNRTRQSKLMLYNIKQNKKYDIGLFRQPLSFKDELRCDLHPRFDNYGSHVCFDSAHTGIRSLCTINFNEAIQNHVINEL